MISVNQIIDKARSFIGTPYRYGGASPSTGFDCSGFLFYIFNQFGINIGRTTYDQIKKGTLITDKNSLLPGDLIFYLDSQKSPYHVVMYTGNNMIIESPRTGFNVREVKMSTWNGVARRIIAPSVVQPPTIPVNPPTPPINPKTYYRVVCGNFTNQSLANNRIISLKSIGFESFLLSYSNGSITNFRVICGSFEDLSVATKRSDDLKKRGYDSFIMTFVN